MNREIYLKKFHELSLDSIKNGLGIGTRIDIDLHNKYKITGSTEYYSNKGLIDQYGLKDLDQDVSIKAQRIIDNPWIENKLDYMHAALREIKFLYVQEDGEYIINRKIIGNQYQHLILYIKEGVDATLYLHTTAEDGEIATEFLDIIIDDDSKLHIIDLRDYGKDYFIYSRKNAKIGKNSNLYWTNIEGPCKLNITEIISSIEGNNSESIMNTIVLAKDSEYNIFTRTNHYAKDTKSLMQVRNIMQKSKAIMRGLVYIGENSSNSNGYQKTEMLMLDNDSRAISIPDLEIHNDEVRCTHGSSISRSDSEKIFYLQSRGLNAEDSERLIVKGFYEVLLSEVPDGLKSNVSDEIEKILYRMK